MSYQYLKFRYIISENWCNPIETFMNGDVVGYKNLPVVGTQITIKCDDGFGLEDPHTGSATCQDDLQWSGDFGKCVCRDPSSTACRKGGLSLMFKKPMLLFLFGLVSFLGAQLAKPAFCVADFSQLRKNAVTCDHFASCLGSFLF